MGGRGSRGGSEELAELELACSRSPDDPEALNRLGGAYYRRGALTEAERCYRRAVELDPSSPVYHNNLGNALSDANRLSDGIAEYRAALRLAGGESAPEARLNLDLALMEQRLIQERISFFENAVSYHVDSADSRCALGCGYLLKGEHEKAIAEFRQALALDATHHQAAVNLLFTYTVTEGGVTDVRAALTESRAACQEHPAEARLLIHAAEVHEAAGDVGGAAERLVRAMASDPANLEAYDLASRFAEVYPETRETFEQAVASNQTDALSALEYAPGRHHAEVACARVMVGAARFDGAADSWRAAKAQLDAILEQYPESPEAIRLAAEAAEKGDGDAERALRMYEHAAELAVRNHEASFDLGAAYLRAGRLEQAVEAFARASELAPAEAAVFQALRFALNGYRRVRIGEMRFERSAAGGDGAPEEEAELHEDLGRTYLGALMYGDAAQHLKVAASLDPQNATAQSALGRLYAQTGDYEESRRSYERALALAPDLEEAERGLAALAVRTGKLRGFASLRPTRRKPGRKRGR